MKKSVWQTILFSLLFNAFFFTANAQEAAQEIVSGLMSDDQQKIDAALALIEKNHPEEIIPQLKTVLISRNDEKLLLSSFKALKYYPVTKVINEWIEILEKTPSFAVKEQAIDYLASTKDRRVIIPIVDQINNPYFPVRERAIFALKRFNDDSIYPRILNMATGKNPVMRLYSLEAIYHLYDQRLYNLLIDMLKDENHSVRFYVLKCLEKNNLSKALNHIRNTALQDSNPEVRVKAIEIVGKSKANNPYGVLYQSLSDTHADVRYAAIKAIRDLDFRQTSYRLSDILASEKEDRVKELIIDTLISFRSGAGFKGLSKILYNDENVLLRIRASYALGQIDDRNSIPYLVKALNDRENSVRAEACNSLGYYKMKTAIDPLIEIIKSDATPYVRSAALFSIKRIRDKATILPLFDQYVIEKDAVFKEQIKNVIRQMITSAL